MNTSQITATARLWVDYYAQVDAQRTLVRIDAERALDGLKAQLRPVRVDGVVAWRALPLGESDLPALRAVARAVTMTPLGADEKEVVGQLETAVPEALADLDAVAGARRFVAGPAAKEAAADATEFLTEYVQWGTDEHLVATIRTFEPGPGPEDLAVTDALKPHVGLGAIWRSLGTASLVPAPPSTGSSQAAPDVVALRAAITEKNPTHLAVFCAEGRTPDGLLAALGA